MSALQQELNEAHTKVESLEQQLIASQTENKRLRTELERNIEAPIQTEINRHGTEFWAQIQVNCLKDPDAVKVLVKTKQLRVDDMNTNKETLLCVSAKVGSYNMVQFCINAGFDTNHKDAWNMTALDNAKLSGYYHIEQ
eukprot:1069374_1